MGILQLIKASRTSERQDMIDQLSTIQSFGMTFVKFAAVPLLIKLWKYRSKQQAKIFCLLQAAEGQHSIGSICRGAAFLQIDPIEGMDGQDLASGGNNQKDSMIKVLQDRVDELEANAKRALPKASSDAMEDVRYSLTPTARLEKWHQANPRLQGPGKKMQNWQGRLRSELELTEGRTPTSPTTLADKEPDVF